MIREIEVTSLKEAAYNPRVALAPGMPEWERLKNSIEQFGNVEPVVWNSRTGNVVGGHQRLAVLKSLGYKQVPCSVVDMDEADEKLLNVALNKIKGQWDYEKLEEILKDFGHEVAAASGFSAAEIAVMLADNDGLPDGDDSWDDWGDVLDGTEVEPTTGGSYLVTLVFPSAESAKAWAESEGYEPEKIKQGSRTTVIRVEE